MSKKRETLTPAEIANDPSLKWVPYRQMEVIDSDDYASPVRFHAYNSDETIAVTDLVGKPLGNVSRLSVRRNQKGVGHSTPNVAASNFSSLCHEIRKEIHNG